MGCQWRRLFWRGGNTSGRKLDGVTRSAFRASFPDLEGLVTVGRSGAEDASIWRALTGPEGLESVSVGCVVNDPLTVHRLGCCRGVARCVFIYINTCLRSLVHGEIVPLKTPLEGAAATVARPKKSPDDLRDVRTAVMLTERERAELEQRASAYGLSLSDFIRRQTLERALPASVAEQRTRAVLATALLRLGVNLNQITRHMNAGRSPPFHLPDLINDIRGHVDRLTRDESGRNRHR